MKDSTPLKLRSKTGFILSVVLSFGIIHIFCLPLSVKAANLTTESGIPTTLGIDLAISAGLENSPEIQRAEAAVDEKRWKKFETLGTHFLPKLSVSASHYFDVTKYQFNNIVFAGNEILLPAIFPNNQVAINGSIKLFDGLASFYQTNAASLIESAAEEELNRQKFLLTQQIRLAYYKTIAAAALRDVATENVTTLEDHLKQTQIQRQGGSATRYDTLRVEVQLSEARSDAEDTEDEFVVSRKKLIQLMGLTSDERPLTGELPIPKTTKVKGLTLPEKISATRTDLLAYELRAEAADQERKAQNLWYIPTISAGGQFSYYNLLLYNAGIYDNHNYQSAYNLGVFLSWNLFDGGVSFARAKEMSAQKVQAEKVSDAAKIQVPYEFEYWKKRFLSNSSHYQSKQLDVKRSEESVRLAMDEQKAGTRTSTEVLDAELDLFRSRAGVVNAQVKAIESLINLEMILGRNI